MSVITSETLPGVIIGLLIIAVGTLLGVSSTLRARRESRDASSECHL